MKTKRTLQQTALLIVFLLSVTACKKDKKDPGTTPIEVKAITITDLKTLSTSASIKIPDGRTIKGIVISDVTKKNMDSKTLILQEASGKPGVIVTLDAANTFATGDELELTISNQTLSQVNGEIVLQNIPLANVKKTGTSTITPAETTISAILAAKTSFDGTLVKIAATELSGGNGKYSGTLNIKDATGTLTSIVLPAASFSETDYPASVSSITGIVRINADQTRIDFRKTDDIVIGSISKVVIENFENLTPLASLTSSPEEDMKSTGFKTKTNNEWYDSQGYGYIFPLKNVAGNESFTTTGRTYIYLYGDGSGAYNFYNNAGALGLQAPTTKGLKSVSITFAISKATNVPLLNFGTLPTDVLNSSSDYLQIMVSPKIGNTQGVAASGWENFGVADLGELSPKFTEGGKFVTYTWTVPTKEQLQAKGATENDLLNFMEHPSFSVYNTSKTTGGNHLNLILFDKIVLNYGN